MRGTRISKNRHGHRRHGSLGRFGACSISSSLCRLVWCSITPTLVTSRLSLRYRLRLT